MASIDQPQPQQPRRRWLLGGGAAIAAIASLGGWQALARPMTPPPGMT